MADRRVRVPLTKPINLGQLEAETGRHGLSESAKELVADQGSPLTAAQLTAAVAAHTPDPDFGKPQGLIDSERATEALRPLRAKAQAVAAGTDTFSTAEQQRILARLVLRVLRDAP